MYYSHYSYATWGGQFWQPFHQRQMLCSLNNSLDYGHWLHILSLSYCNVLFINAYVHVHMVEGYISWFVCHVHMYIGINPSIGRVL